MQALKTFLAVSKHFFDINEDQFDFHGYCIRKMTLRAYIDMLRMVRSCGGFCSAALVSFRHADIRLMVCPALDVVPL